MKKVFLAICCLFISLILFAPAFATSFPLGQPHPSRRSIQQNRFNFQRSSEVVAAYSGTFNVQLATGVISFNSVNVTSGGVNSVIIIRDSNLFSLGNSTFTLNPRGDNTNSVEKLEFLYQSSTQGIVYTSTCSACAAPWSPPVFRFIFERER